MRCWVWFLGNVTFDVKVISEISWPYDRVDNILERDEFPSATLEWRWTKCWVDGECTFSNSMPKFVIDVSNRASCGQLHDIRWQILAFLAVSVIFIRSFFSKILCPEYYIIVCIYIYIYRKLAWRNSLNMYSICIVKWVGLIFDRYVFISYEM